MRRFLLTLVLFGVAVAGVALAPSKAEARGHGWRAGYYGYYPSYYGGYYTGYYPYATSYYSYPATSYYYTPAYSYGYGGYGYGGYGGYGYRYNPGGLGGPWSGLGVRPGLGFGGFGLRR
jgi:hypothetical protein